MRRYQHGADVVGALEQYGIEEKNVVDFSSNVNLFTSSRLHQLLSSVEVSDLTHYPDVHYRRLKEKIAQRYGLHREEVLVGNGATELIHLIARHSEFQRIGMIHPTFSEYERAAEISGKKIVSLYLNEVFELGDYREEIGKLDLLFVCNPNNPDGRLKDLRGLIQVCSEAGCSVCVDETFIEFSSKEDGYSLLSLLCSYPNLMILRALTKVYSLAGLRLGYLFTSRERVLQLEELQEPWSVNGLAEKFIDVLFDRELLEKTKRFYEQETMFMYEQLSKLKGVRAYPTDVNFILFELTGNCSAGELKRELIQNYGMLIRDCSNYRALTEKYVRINIKDREKNQEILKAIQISIDTIEEKRKKKR